MTNYDDKLIMMAYYCYLTVHSILKYSKRIDDKLIMMAYYCYLTVHNILKYSKRIEYYSPIR